MNQLWKCIDKNEWNMEMKQRIYLWTATILWAMAGAIIWLGCSMAIPSLNHGNMLFCFAGYPAFYGWVCAVLQLMNKTN